MADRPVVGITMGDPAGIGPEIIIKALCKPDVYEVCRPVVLGDKNVLSAAFSSLASAVGKHVCLNEISSASMSKGVFQMIDIISLSALSPGTVIPGRPTVAGGRAMVNYIIKAVRMIQSRELDAMVTCPISKVLMHKAGYDYEGHTQLIAELTDTDDYVMMLAGKKLRVTLVTIHCALRDVPDLLSKEAVYRTIRITDMALRTDFALEKPKIAVAALNPHAGEEGLFGTEEEEFIRPAIEMALHDGALVYGPFPPDTVFSRAASSEFDAVVAMYHDQGLIPLKLMHFSDAVNVTLGLPIIRTSVDHGTAYDIAGKGKADPSSLVEAIKLAACMKKNRDQS